ncbi:cytochrome c [Paenibacillus sp. BSR1-1]|uniref:cytochrome c551 n=1 Tax=Paenibacillus sp. BSR1-1 TaxID=3020845 RepID=UPI0025B06F5A|nr:cytochrome c [Paenibacillus sp. BSR1-1]MDN3019042.1 cytochrome c [Paenibacillus sp. BSR1-1]
MKKKLLTLLMGTSLVMGLAACGGGSDDDNGKDTASGGEAVKIVDQKCSGCHGGDLKGAMGPDLTKIGSKYSKDEILDILKNGKSGGMPANLVEGDDAETVAAWLSEKK